MALRSDELRVEIASPSGTLRRMSESARKETRTVTSPATGSKVCLIIAAVLLVAAGYFYWVPVSRITSTGAAFGCRSAANPPTDIFPKVTCGTINRVNLDRESRS